MLSAGAVVVDSAILVVREGLEVILLLSALAASMNGGSRHQRRPMLAGSALALLATLVTWFLVVGLIRLVNAPAVYVEAVTGMLAVAVLVVIMNWFFHRVYWTGWMGHHHRRKKQLLSEKTGRRLLLGLMMLGFTAVYREGFEVVLFLQSFRLQAGDLPVAEGVGIAMLLLTGAAYVAIIAHQRLPYKRLLVLTGVMLGFVFTVMVGESAQQLQEAGWLTLHAATLPIPGWMGTWFAVFPNLEGLIAQATAALVVLGSYFSARFLLERHQAPAALEPEVALSAYPRRSRRVV